MNRSPVKDVDFEKAYRSSKAHAAKFGWSQTNADIRLVSGTRDGTPALGNLKPEHWAELHAKWEMDLAEAGTPPAPEYELFNEVIARHRGRFGAAKTRASLKLYGGQPWGPNIKHALRLHVMRHLESEIDTDIQRARAVAGKKVAAEVRAVNASRPPEEARVNLGVAAVNDERPTIQKVRGRRRGPVEAAILNENTLRLQAVTVRFGSRVKMADGKWGRVTSLQLSDEGSCNRLVVLMNDLTTRIYTHADALAFYVTGVAPREADKPHVRFADGGIAREQPTSEWEKTLGLIRLGGG